MLTLRRSLIYIAYLICKKKLSSFCMTTSHRAPIKILCCQVNGICWTSGHLSKFVNLQLLVQIMINQACERFSHVYTQKKTMCLISRLFLLIQHQIQGKIVMLDWLVSYFSDIFCCYILTEFRSSHCSTSLDFLQSKSSKR